MPCGRADAPPHAPMRPRAHTGRSRMLDPSGPTAVSLSCWSLRALYGVVVATIVTASWTPISAQATPPPRRTAISTKGASAEPGLSAADARGTVERHCVTCHNARLKIGDLSLEG